VEGGGGRRIGKGKGGIERKVSGEGVGACKTDGGGGGGVG